MIEHNIKVGDEVRILIGEGDTAHYGMTREMRAVKGEVGTVTSVRRDQITVAHPAFQLGYNYKSSEVEKVEEKGVRTQEFKVGDRVKIVSHGAYGSNGRMDEGLNGYGEVVRSEYPGTHDRTALIHVALDDGLGTHVYDHHELQTVVRLRGRKVDSVIVDDPAAEHIQSHDELVAENESLEKQIRKLEARVERKKEFQRQNVRKIAAWQVILEK